MVLQRILYRYVGLRHHSMEESSQLSICTSQALVGLWDSLLARLCVSQLLKGTVVIIQREVFSPCGRIYPRIGQIVQCLTDFAT